MQVFKAGALYFAVVFAVGFALGTVRVLWLVPRVSERTAELAETSFMLAVSLLAARRIVRRFALPPRTAARLGAGLVAVALLLAMEFGFVLTLRGLTLRNSSAPRDPVSGAAYALSLAWFALMPLLVSRR